MAGERLVWLGGAGTCLGTRPEGVGDDAVGPPSEGPWRRRAGDHRFGREGPVGPLRGAMISGGLAHRLGIYEFAAQQEFWRLVRAGDRVFDVGAHLGFFRVSPHAQLAPRAASWLRTWKPWRHTDAEVELGATTGLRRQRRRGGRVGEHRPGVRFRPRLPEHRGPCRCRRRYGAMVVDGVTLDSLRIDSAALRSSRSMWRVSAGAVLRGGNRVLQASGERGA